MNEREEDFQLSTFSEPGEKCQPGADEAGYIPLLQGWSCRHARGAEYSTVTRGGKGGGGESRRHSFPFSSAARRDAVQQLECRRLLDLAAASSSSSSASGDPVAVAQADDARTRTVLAFRQRPPH